MGRKKKGECSREAILGNMEKDKELNEVSKKGSKTARKKKVVLPDSTVDKVDKEDEEDKEEEHSDVEDFGEEEVFGECVELEDFEELTRLMSVVDIEDSPVEYEKQLNLAGN